MFAFQPLREPARKGQIDVDDPPTSLAIEMLMRIEIPVIARRARRTRHLIDLAIRDEDFEISVDGPERESRHFGHERVMDLGRRRMRLGLSNPGSDAISLARTVATRRCQFERGGVDHELRIEGPGAQEQVKVGIFRVLGFLRRRIQSN